MLKLAFATILVTGLAGAAPAFAETNGTSGIGRGCTLDPFEHVMRCIDFDKCTTDKDGNSLEGRAEVIVGKQRNGPTGIVNLFFHKAYTRFENYSARSTDQTGGAGPGRPNTGP